MNIVLKDTDFIKSCTSPGFRKSFKGSNWTFCFSELTILDFNMIELYTIENSIKNKEIFKYGFDEKELEKVYTIYNQYADNISVSDAGAIVLAQKLKNSLIINRNGVFSEICDKHLIKNENFEWFFENIK